MNELLKKMAVEFSAGPVDTALAAPLIEQLMSGLLNLTGLNLNGGQEQTHMSSEKGIALGTTWAATCVQDVKRTASYMGALVQVIQQKLDEGKQPVRLLYAGTGPFAALALPAMAYFSPAQLQVTLIELNPLTYSTLQTTVDQLSMRGYVEEMLNADATSFQVEKEYDILLSETMQRALSLEPQVAIFMNLIPQLKPETVVLPQKVLISAGMMNGSRFEQDPRAREANFSEEYPVMELSKEKMHAFSGSDSSIGIVHTSFAGMRPDPLQAFDLLVLLTDIQIYEEYKLDMMDSGLTVPLFLTQFSHASPVQLRFDYEIGYEPKMHFDVIG